MAHINCVRYYNTLSATTFIILYMGPSSNLLLGQVDFVSLGVSHFIQMLIV